MRFYGDIVAAGPILAFMPSAPDRTVFGAAMGYLLCNSRSPSFADPRPDSEAVFARRQTRAPNFIVLESPVPAR